MTLTSTGPSGFHLKPLVAVFAAAVFAIAAFGVALWVGTDTKPITSASVDAPAQVATPEVAPSANLQAFEAGKLDEAPLLPPSPTVGEPAPRASLLRRRVRTSTPTPPASSTWSSPPPTQVDTRSAQRARRPPTGVRTKPASSTMPRPPRPWPSTCRAATTARWSPGSTTWNTPPRTRARPMSPCPGSPSARAPTSRHSKPANSTTHQPNPNQPAAPRP